MTDKLITEQKVRLILDKTYIDGVKSGKGGLGYSERAFDQFMELLADERAKVLSEVESWLDEMPIWIKIEGKYGYDPIHNKADISPFRQELRAKLNKLKEAKC